MRWLALLLPAILLSALPAPADEASPFDAKAAAQHLKWLADDDREGRAAGTEGAIAAGEYIAGHFRELGLEPVGDDGTYFQTFDLPRGFEVQPETRVEAVRGTKTASLTYPDGDISPLSISGSGEVEAAVAFCGYGIAAPELGYDDYEGVDVKGRVVVVLRGAPGLENRKSPFSNPAAQRRYGTFQAKADTAVAAGAAALVIVNDPGRFWKPKDDVILSDVGGNPGKIPVLHVTCKAGKKLFKTLGMGLQKAQKSIDARRKPRSKAIDDATMKVVAALVSKRLDVRNICARLRAPGDAKDPRETLLLGGHFDHIGRGEYGSRAGSKGKGEVHNGADDNASGTAMVMELAAFLLARQSSLRRDVLFVLFTGEELGLLGSKHYVEHPLVPLSQTVTMLNFDMVGRLERGSLQIGGTGTSPVFEPLLDAKNKKLRIKTRYNRGGKAPSDNSPFYEKGIPVMFFFTGLHSDYHRPDDDYKDVDRRGMDKIGQLAAEVCLDLASRPVRPPFVRADGSAMATGPHLGLAVEQRQNGVFVTWIEPKSPAAKARFQVGDKVEEFAGQPIKNTSDFSEAHSLAKPKSVVTITVRRGPRLIDLKPKLGRK